MSSWCEIHNRDFAQEDGEEILRVGRRILRLDSATDPWQLDGIPFEAPTGTTIELNAE
jgi:hypothetical protein